MYFIPILNTLSFPKPNFAGKRKHLAMETRQSIVILSDRSYFMCGRAGQF